METQYLKLFKLYGFNFAKCLGSKSSYRKEHSNNLIIFNARIYLKEHHLKYLNSIKDFFKGQDYEIWYGDLDLTKDISMLYHIQLKIGKPIVITSEHGSKIIEIGE